MFRVSIQREVSPADDIHPQYHIDVSVYVVKDSHRQRNVLPHVAWKDQHNTYLHFLLFRQVADGTFQQEVFKPASLCNTSGYDTDLGTRVPQRLAVETVCRPDIGDMDWRYQPRSPQRQLLSIYIILHHNSIQRSKDK